MRIRALSLPRLIIAWAGVVAGLETAPLNAYELLIPELEFRTGAAAPDGHL
jgi:hypothetical protein